MKAVVYTEYGSPDVLRLEEVEKPTPKDNEILIKIHATATNPFEWRHLEAKPAMIRLMGAGLFKPKHNILGADVAGEVEAVGKDVTQFKPGDAVFGECVYGGFAEYVCGPEKAFVHKPANLSFEEAASVPMVGLTALQGLRDTGKIKAGQQVLINGASGGIGTIAVQLARHFGTQVSGVCSGRNEELIRSLGAVQVIDYTKEDFSRTGQQYDLIFCTVGNRSAAAYKRALKPGGICSVAGFTTFPHMIMQVMLLGSWISRRTDKTITSMGVAQIRQKDLQYLADLLAEGTIKPVIDRTYPLEETAAAIRYLETHHARGKVVVTVA